jgi:tellurite resistance protein TehA-like permease
VPDPTVSRVQQSVQSLTPGYFALVMASGIVSIGFLLEDYVWLSVVLMWVCLVAYLTLVVLSVWRFVAFRDAVVDDFNDARRGFGFFTFVAGTNVLGVRLAVDGYHSTALILLCVAGVTWLVLGYVVPWTAVLRVEQRPVVDKANGTWFIWVVASQSMAVSAATLEPLFAEGRRELALIAVFSWSVGLFLYGAAGIFVSARLMLYPLKPQELTPPYWVAMGACAITVLAGARIVEMASAPMADAARGLASGLSVVFWAFATWLVPVLVAAGWWRHVTNRVPLHYEATLWSIIFPLGMYSVASIYLGTADALPIVGHIGSVALWVAFTAWAFTFTAMVVNFVRTVVRPSPGALESTAGEMPWVERP